MFLSITDVQKIVDAVIKESEMNDEFKALALSDVEQAIRFVINRDFPDDLQERYDKTIKYYKNHLKGTRST